MARPEMWRTGVGDRTESFVAAHIAWLGHPPCYCGTRPRYCPKYYASMPATGPAIDDATLRPCIPTSGSPEMAFMSHSRHSRKGNSPDSCLTVGTALTANLKTSCPFMNRLEKLPWPEAPSPRGLPPSPLNAQCRCFCPLPSAMQQEEYSYCSSKH